MRRVSLDQVVKQVQSGALHPAVKDWWKRTLAEAVEPCVTHDDCRADKGLGFACAIDALPPKERARICLEAIHAPGVIPLSGDAWRGDAWLVDHGTTRGGVQVYTEHEGPRLTVRPVFAEWSRETWEAARALFAIQEVQ